MKPNTRLVTAAVLASLAIGCGQAFAAPGPAPDQQSPGRTCVMSADAVEAWTARGARLPACVRESLGQSRQEQCRMSADAAEAWTARGARLPACVEAANSR